MPLWILVAFAQWILTEISGAGPITGIVTNILTGHTKAKNTQLQSIASEISRLAEQVLYEIERSNSIRTPSTQIELTFDKLKQTANSKFKQEIYNIQKQVDAIQNWGTNETDRAASENVWDKISTHNTRQQNFDKANKTLNSYNQRINDDAKSLNNYLQGQAATVSNTIQGINDSNKNSNNNNLTKGNINNGVLSQQQKSKELPK